MCGIAGIVTTELGCLNSHAVEAMRDRLRHRGPDDRGLYAVGGVALGNTRLNILDLSPAGRQPMATPDGRWQIVFNGEIYNYLELREELQGEVFRTGTDTEVLLRAFERWGVRCLERLNGMFAFAVWDATTRTLFAARDRFGVKPLYYAITPGRFVFASEIKALFEAGIPREADLEAWRHYLVLGLYDHSDGTFFNGIRQLPPGHYLTWREGRLTVVRYYDLAERLAAGEPTAEPEELVAERYRALMVDAVRLRFRSDVPVGICLSGGLDSSALLAMVHQVWGPDCDLKTFTYTCGDPAYDERPWVETMIEQTKHHAFFSVLSPPEVPDLARRVQRFQDEPFGGLPTLALAKMFGLARQQEVTVLLDGQGLDEQWAGYDYYAQTLRGSSTSDVKGGAPALPMVTGPVQATRSAAVRPECLTPEFREGTAPVVFPEPFRRPLQNLRYRDIRYTKIPRALRFNDRISMMHSLELREPFLDYRMVELALRQPDDRLIHAGVHKYLLRRIVAPLLPARVAGAPKRAVQTPQREWLAGPLCGWVEDLLASRAFRTLGWFDRRMVEHAWAGYLAGESDNSFYVWQWVSVALMFEDEA